MIIGGCDFVQVLWVDIALLVYVVIGIHRVVLLPLVGHLLLVHVLVACVVRIELTAVLIGLVGSLVELWVLELLKGIWEVLRRSELATGESLLDSWIDALYVVLLIRVRRWTSTYVLSSSRRGSPPRLIHLLCARDPPARARIDGYEWVVPEVSRWRSPGTGFWYSVSG